jgi:peptidoglycan/LPS O-acetylase OafA/YrhL
MTGPRADGSHIRALDGVRGIAILAVLVYHFLGAGIVLAEQGRSPTLWIDRTVVRVVGTGWAGVDLFFVLSGFLITRILLSAREGHSYFRSFYARRVLRIFPVYYALLFFLIVILPYLPGFRADADLTKLRHHQLEYWTYLCNIAVSLHPLVDRGNYVGQLWSLAVEEQFYLVWPALVLLLGRRRLGVFCVLCIIAAPIIRYGLVHGAVPQMHNTLAAFTLMPARMDALTIGGLVAVIAAEPSLLRRALPWMKVAGASAALFLAVLFLKRGGLSGFDEPVLVLGFSALAVTFAAFLTLVIGGSPGSLQAMCKARVLTFFGQYSYGLYIVRFVIMEQLVKRFSRHGGLPVVLGSSLPAGVGFAALGIGLSVVLAWLSWHLFEKHFLKLKRFVPYGGRHASADLPATTDKPILAAP